AASVYSRQGVTVPVKSISGGDAQVAPRGGFGSLTLFGRGAVKVKSNSGLFSEPTGPEAVSVTDFALRSMHPPGPGNPASGPLPAIGPPSPGRSIHLRRVVSV